MTSEIEYRFLISESVPGSGRAVSIRPQRVVLRSLLPAIEGWFTLSEMPRKPTGRPPGRPRNTTPADAHCYVRMTGEQRALVERAAEQAHARSPMTGKLSVAQWLLTAGVAAAEAELGKKER